MPDFEEHRRGPKRALVSSTEGEAIVSALFDAKECTPMASAGRGTVSCFPLATGRGLVRQYLRGGILRHILRDRYLLNNRPRREWALHTFLFDEGFPVPEPLGVMWEKRGLLFSGALATRYVEAQHLLDFLQASPPQAGAILLRVGKVVRRMHELGVYHADLQVKNILIGPAETFIIDFDNARRYDKLSHLARCRNLLRLRRSFDKNGLPAKDFDTLCKGYDIRGFPRWLDYAYEFKGVLSNMLSGRKRRSC